MCVTDESSTIHRTVQLHHFQFFTPKHREKKPEQYFVVVHVKYINKWKLQQLKHQMNIQYENKNFLNEIQMNPMYFFRILF